MQRPGNHLIAPDLLRFGCALSVVAYHLLTQFWLQPNLHVTGAFSGAAPPPISWSLAAQYGWTGVELFFVISGVMITKAGRGASPSSFVRARVLRLVPIAWLCATATALLLILDHQDSIFSRWSRSMLFAPWGMQVDASYWTLGIEMAFYALFAHQVLGGRRRISCDALAGLLAAWSLAYWLISLAVGLAGGHFWNNRATQLLLMEHGCFFSVGILLVMVQEQGWSRTRVAIASAAAFGCVMEVLAHSVERGIGLGVPVTPAPAILLVGAGVMLLCYAPRLQPVLERSIGSSVARALGLISYPLYLIHQEASVTVIGWLVRSGASTPVAILAAASAMVMAATLMALMAEPAIRRRLAAGFDVLLGAAAGSARLTGRSRMNAPALAPRD